MTCILMRSGQRHVRAKRKNHVRTQWEGGHLQAKKRVLRRTDDLILDCYPPELWEREKKSFSCLSHLVHGTMLWQSQQTLHGGWPVCCRMFSSIPDPLPNDNCRNPSIWQLWHYQMSHEGQNLLPFITENHCFKWPLVIFALPVLSTVTAT